MNKKVLFWSITSILGLSSIYFGYIFLFKKSNLDILKNKFPDLELKTGAKGQTAWYLVRGNNLYTFYETGRVFLFDAKNVGKGYLKKGNWNAKDIRWEDKSNISINNI